MMDVQGIIVLITGIVTAASVICAATPTPPEGSPWRTLYSVVEALALLFGRAKDK